MKPVNIVIVGSGYIAHYHARALSVQPEVRIKALCSVDKQTAGDFAAKYGIEYVTDDVQELVRRGDIDGAVLCTPNCFHAPHAIAFLETGKSVFIEKPMALNAEEGKQISSVARQHLAVVMVGHMWRYDTEVNYLRQAVQEGILGTIVRTKGYGIHLNWGPEGWFTRKELAGGGALADMGVHAIDAVRYILNDPLPKEVYAKIATCYGDYDVDDTAMVMITWDNGVVSCIESGWWQPHMDGPEAATQVFGTRGYGSVFPTRLKLKLQGKWGEFIPEMPRRSEHCDQVIYTRQMEDFINAVRNGTEPGCSWRQGQVILEILDAAYESARSQSVVQM